MSTPAQIVFSTAGVLDLDELNYVYASLAVDRSMRAPQYGLGRVAADTRLGLEAQSEVSVLCKLRGILDDAFPLNEMVRDLWFERKDTTAELTNLKNVTAITWGDSVANNKEAAAAERGYDYVAYTDGSVLDPTRYASLRHNRGGAAWYIKDKTKKRELEGKRFAGHCVHPMLAERDAMEGAIEEIMKIMKETPNNGAGPDKAQ